MSIKSLLLVVVFLAGLGINAQTARADDDYMVKRFWANQEEAISDIMIIFARGGPKKEYGDALLKLVQAESGLMAYGVPFNDSRLVSHLAKGLNRSAPEVFAYRLFKLRVESLTGFRPGPPGETLEGSAFRVLARGSSRTVKINF